MAFGSNWSVSFLIYVYCIYFWFGAIKFSLGVCGVYASMEVWVLNGGQRGVGRGRSGFSSSERCPRDLMLNGQRMMRNRILFFLKLYLKPKSRHEDHKRLGASQKTRWVTNHVKYLLQIDCPYITMHSPYTRDTHTAIAWTCFLCDASTCCQIENTLFTALPICLPLCLRCNKTVVDGALEKTYKDTGECTLAIWRDSFFSSWKPCIVQWYQFAIHCSTT